MGSNYKYRLSWIALHCNGNYGEAQNDGVQVAFEDITMACALVSPPVAYPKLVEEYHAAVDTLERLAACWPKPWVGFAYNDLGERNIRLRHQPILVSFPVVKRPLANQAFFQDNNTKGLHEDGTSSHRFLSLTTFPTAT